MNTKDLNKNKIDINERHLKLFEKSLEGLEMILDGFLYDLRSYDESFLTLSKNTMSVLESVISSLIKIQKGERLALGLSDEPDDIEIEPVINIIEGVDFKKL